MSKSLDEFGRLCPVNFPTLGWGVLGWVEKHLRHGPGDVDGEPIVIDDEFALFLAHAYRVDERGRRVHRRAILSRPKGRAKSELAGMVVCAEALGPVRFDRWDGDRPVGRPVRSPFIRCLATEETQAGNTYDNVRAMLEGLRERDLEFRGVDVGLTRTLLPGGGEIRPSTASASAKDGGRETFVVADETHLYTTPELRQMHRTVSRNLAKRKAAEPWLLDTTTAFQPGEESVAEQAFEMARVTKAATRARLLVDHRQAGDVADWDDDTAVLEALRDVYGPAAEWMDLDLILADIRAPGATRSDGARYFLNRVEVAEDQLVDPEVWRGLAVVDTIADGELVTLGFDGSVRDDTTALVACRVSDGLLVTLGVWGPDGSGMVPRDDVDQAVRSAFDRFEVWRMYADPPYWQAYLDAWSAMWPQQVVEWWTNRPAAVGHALERLTSAVGDGSLRHDGHEVLTEHVVNARRRTVRGHLSMSKEFPKSRRKIDAAMAAMLAFEARGDAVAAGVGSKRARRAASF